MHSKRVFRAWRAPRGRGAGGSSPTASVSDRDSRRNMRDAHSRTLEYLRGVPARRHRRQRQRKVPDDIASGSRAMRIERTLRHRASRVVQGEAPKHAGATNRVDLRGGRSL
jgi:hypothetical protein